MTYLEAIAALVCQSARAVTRTPSHSRRAEARRRMARHWLWSFTAGAAFIVLLMFFVDAAEIRLMPARGTPSLWPLKIVTDFGKATYILQLLGIAILLTLLLTPLLIRSARLAMIGLSQRLLFLFLAVGVPIEIGEIVKGIVGRGRPFVGGAANAFNYSHFSWTEAYASFPSGHSIAASALAFGIASLWPRAGIAVCLYALLIIASRLVLLAHHPSDVVAGALLGVIGAMFVRYWFASRRLLFRIGSDGAIYPRRGPRFGLPKGLPTAQ